MGKRQHTEGCRGSQLEEENPDDVEESSRGSYLESSACPSDLQDGRRQNMGGVPMKRKKKISGWHVFIQEIINSVAVEQDSGQRLQLGDISKEARKRWNALTSEEKEVYNTMAAANDMEQVPKTIRARPLQTRCSPKKIRELASLMSEAQREVMRGLGFGALMKIPDVELPRTTVLWLVDRFNKGNMEIMFEDGQSLPITTVQVGLILGIPCEGVEVPQCLSNQRKLELNAEYNGLERKGLTKKLEDEIRRRQTDDRFIRSAILYILHHFLCPSLSGCIGERLLAAVDDVSQISRINWAKFVLDTLVAGIGSYQSNAKCRGSGISGCLYFLVIHYFENICREDVKPIFDGVPIEKWTKPLLQRRVKLEEAIQENWIVQSRNLRRGISVKAPSETSSSTVTSRKRKSLPADILYADDIQDPVLRKAYEKIAESIVVKNAPELLLLSQLREKDMNERKLRGNVSGASKSRRKSNKVRCDEEIGDVRGGNARISHASMEVGDENTEETVEDGGGEWSNHDGGVSQGVAVAATPLHWGY